MAPAKLADACGEAPALNIAVLSWLHFGELQITGADEHNYRDYLKLIDAANRYLAGVIDVAVLPDDNADDGAEAQFQLVRQAIDPLAIPLHILPGGHDFKSRNRDAFHNVLGAGGLPEAFTGGAWRRRTATPTGSSTPPRRAPSAPQP